MLLLGVSGCTVCLSHPRCPSLQSAIKPTLCSGPLCLSTSLSPPGCISGAPPHCLGVPVFSPFSGVISHSTTLATNPRRQTYLSLHPRLSAGAPGHWKKPEKEGLVRFCEPPFPSRKHRQAVERAIMQISLLPHVSAQRLLGVLSPFCYNLCNIVSKGVYYINQRLLQVN